MEVKFFPKNKENLNSGLIMATNGRNPCKFYLKFGYIQIYKWTTYTMQTAMKFRLIHGKSAEDATTTRPLLVMTGLFLRTFLRVLRNSEISSLAIKPARCTYST
jgi:hypothetical protein